MKKSRLAVVFSACLWLFLSLSIGSAHAVTVVNGSMNVAGGANVQNFNGVLPDGWLDIELTSSTDIFDSSTNFNQFTWAPSTDGGTFVHALGPISGLPGEGIKQDISGLTIGATYQVNFEQSIARSNNVPQVNGGFWEVVFGSETMQSTFMDNPALGVAFGWLDQSLSFTAAATTQTISFRAVPDIVGNRIGLGLDGVSIFAVPVPAAVWLFGSGLLGLVGITRRKKA